jgi:two-component system, response regulator PdtaR
VIAEDEGVTQLQLQRILKSVGVDVVGIAANGLEVIDLVESHEPDFVLMDIRMPVMDGLEASRRILENKNVCIVMLTAFSEEEFQRKAEEIGASGYILKPVTSGTLVPRIVSALHRFSEQ